MVWYFHNLSLEDGSLLLPGPSLLLGTSESVPYVIVKDEAFPL